MPFKDGILENEDDVIIAGLGYTTPWTRDAAINTWNAGVYTVGTFGSNQKGNTFTLNMREQVQPIFAQYGVDLVLQAHEHIYSRTKPLDENGNIVNEGGVIYMTSLPASGGHEITKIYDNEGDDYIINKDKYEDVTAGGYAHAWTEIGINGTAIEVKTYSLCDAALTLIDSFIVNG